MAKAAKSITVEEWVEIEEHLTWTIRWLQGMQRHLREALSIGVWMKSDDSSDNRNKRRELSDAASDAWSAADQLSRITAFEMQKALNPMLAEIRELENALRPLAESILDTMGENPALDRRLGQLEDQMEELVDKVGGLMEFRPTI